MVEKYRIQIKLAVIFILNRISLVCLILWSRYNITGVVNKWYEVLIVLDSGWYLDIIKNGYSIKEHLNAQTNLAFSPLYPTLVKYFGNILNINYKLAGVLLSNISLIFALIIMYKYVSKFHDKKYAYYTVLAIIIFPTSFVFSGLYTESLFIVLVILTMYFAKQKRFMVAGIVGYFLALTRILGVFIVIPIFIEMLMANNLQFKKIRNQSIKESIKYIINILKKLISTTSTYSLILPILGYMTFSAYLYKLTGNWFAQSDAVKLWERTLSIPFMSLITHSNSVDIYVLFAVLFVLGIFGLLSYNIKKMYVSEIVLSILFLFPLMTCSLPTHYKSMPRYTLIIFPIYISIGYILKNKKFLRFITILASVILQLFSAYIWSIQI